MIEQKGNNVINNYKGVMLCSRPNENTSAPIEKPFCGRVFPHEQIGLIPSSDNQRPQVQEEKKPRLEILHRHKKWLQDFKNYKAKQKEDKFIKIQVEEEKFKKIKQMAEVDRERARKMRNQYNQTATNVLEVLDEKPSFKTQQLTKENLRILDQKNEKEEAFKKKKKKGEKPIWAQTQEQIEKKEEEEVDELLDFFENTEVNKYSEDQQVKEILKNLKEKIEGLKKEDDWKEKQAEKMKKVREQKAEKNVEDDKYSQFSVNSQAKSVASEKTQKKLQELRNKAKQQEEWDKFTTTSKSSHANIEEKIAKNLADQVLRNYPNLKGVHSNTSIRKLLEAEAAKAINEPIPRPVITTVIKDKKPLDTNNLPYLHRNPAI